MRSGRGPGRASCSGLKLLSTQFAQHPIDAERQKKGSGEMNRAALWLLIGPGLIACDDAADVDGGFDAGDDGSDPPRA